MDLVDSLPTKLMGMISVHHTPPHHFAPSCTIFVAPHCTLRQIHHKSNHITFFLTPSNYELHCYSNVVFSLQPKPSFYGFKNFMAILGSYHHVEALQETNTSYIYILQNNAGTKKLVAWRPVDGSASSQEVQVTTTITGYKLLDSTFVEIGLGQSDGLKVLPLGAMTQSGTSWTMNVTGYIRVANVTAMYEYSSPLFAFYLLVFFSFID